MKNTNPQLSFFGLMLLIFIVSCEEEEPVINLPPDLSDESISVDENTPPGTLIASLQASDPEDGSLTYTLLSQSPFEAFELNSIGELRVAAGVTISHEDQTEFALQVEASDGSDSDSGTIRVLVNDLPESFEIALRPDTKEGQDAILYSLAPDNNYGDHRQFNAQAWTNGGTPQTMRSLIKFRLDDLPSHAEIESAALSLYHFVASNNPGHSQIDGSNESTIKRVLDPWQEATVTWNTQPATTDMDAVTLLASTSETQNYESIDITGLMIDAEGTRLPNHGFMLSLKTEEFYRSLVFASSDGPEDLRPKLVIRYID